MNQGMEEKLARYLSGESSAHEEAELLEACRRDPRFLQEVTRLVAVDRLIAQGVVGSAGDVFTEEVLCRLLQRPGDSVLADQVTRRIEAEGRKVSAPRLHELVRAVRHQTDVIQRPSGMPSPRAMKIGILSAVAACLLMSLSAFLLVRYELNKKVRDSVVLKIDASQATPGQQAESVDPVAGPALAETRQKPSGVAASGSEKPAPDSASSVAVSSGSPTAVATSATPRRAVARLYDVVPGMWIERDGQKLQVQPGQDVIEGDIVATRPFELFDPDAITVSDPSPRVQVRYIAEKTAIALGAGTRVKFDRVDGRKHIELLEGRVLCQVAAQRPGLPMHVVSPLARCTVLGTVFWLESQERQVRLEVDEGVVQMTDLATKKSVETVAGQYASLEKEGSLVRGKLPPVDLAGNLLAHWDFEDAGRTVDLAGRHSGEAAGVGRVEGKFGKAANFTGGQSIAIPDLQLTPAFTLSCWVKMPAKTSSLNTLLANSVADNSTDGFRWFIHHGNHGPFSVVFETGNGVARLEGETDPRTGPHAFAPDRWHHLLIRCDQLRREAQIYVDGRPQAIERETELDFKLTGPFSIGSMNGPGAFFRGQMDELRIYGRLLNEREIHALAGSVADLFGRP